MATVQSPSIMISSETVHMEPSSTSSTRVYGPQFLSHLLAEVTINVRWFVRIFFFSEDSPATCGHYL
jgi:hypothetical protein